MTDRQMMDGQPKSSISPSPFQSRAIKIVLFFVNRKVKIYGNAIG